MDMNYLKKYTKQSIDKDGNTLMHKAIKSEDLSLLYKICSMETNVNKRNRDGSSALHYAVKRGKTSFVDAILQCGVDPTLTNKVGQTAIDIAQLNGRTDIESMIRQYYPGLQTAIYQHNVALVINLLKKWVNLSNVRKSIDSSYLKDMDLGHYEDTNNFIHLVASDDIVELQLLWKQGKLGDVNTVHPITGCNALVLSIRNGNENLTKFLLDKCQVNSAHRLINGTPLSNFALDCTKCPFSLIMSLLRSNPITWHMKCPITKNTFLFDLLRNDLNYPITEVHISAILRLTDGHVLRDIDSKGRNFIDACKELEKPQEYMDAVYKCIVEFVIGGKVNQLKLVELVCHLIGHSKSLFEIPDRIFEELCINRDQIQIQKKFKTFVDNIDILEKAASNLKIAIEENNLEEVKKNNIAIFVFENGITALHLSILLNRYEIAKWLVTERPRLMYVCDRQNRYPLHYAYSVMKEFGTVFINLLLENSDFKDLEQLTDMNNNVPSETKDNILF